jgi:hypothetical protein
MKVLLVGKGLTLVLALVTFVMYLSPAISWTVVAFGRLATTIQDIASKQARKVPADAKFAEFAKGWAAGMGLRTLGVVVLAVVCTVWPETFPAIGAAIGYLGVLLPLLFLETRTAR